MDKLFVIGYFNFFSRRQEKKFNGMYCQHGQKRQEVEQIYRFKPELTNCKRFNIKP